MEDDFNFDDFMNGSDSDGYGDRDPDNDGLSDGEEIKKYLTNATNPDSDGDNFNDGFEIDKDTDPLNDEDFPKEDNKKSSSPDYQVYIIIGIIIMIFLIFIAIIFNRKLKKKHN